MTLLDLDVDAVEQSLRAGTQWPGPDVFRHIGYLRTVYYAATFAAQYFPATNITSTGPKDVRTVLTGIGEMIAIAEQLYQLNERGIPGGVVECGCYKGFSTSVLSVACSLIGRPLDVYDSFQGLPPSSSSYYRAGDFAGSLDEVRQHVSAFGRPDAVRYHPGFFSDSIPRRTPAPIAILWLDVDLADSARDALRLMADLDPRGTLFTHECVPELFDSSGHLVPRGGPDDVIAPIVEAFAHAGRGLHGTFLTGNLGACWDPQTGIPVVSQAAVERLLHLAVFGAS